MARNQGKPLQVKLFSVPSELEFVAAKEVIREENSKKCLHHKEKICITRAIMQVEREFSNRRNNATLCLSNREKQGKLLNSKVHVYSETVGRMKQYNPHDFLPNMPTNYSRLHYNLLRVQYLQESMPGKQQLRTENVKLSPVTLKHKCNMKNQINENIRIIPDEKATEKEINNLEPEESKEEIVTFNGGRVQEIQYETLDGKIISGNNDKRFRNLDEIPHKWKLFYFWTVWRMVTFKKKKENHKLTRIKKIDLFLKRLEATADQIQKLKKDRRLCQKLKKKTFLQSDKTKPYCDTEDTQKLYDVEKELAESAVEACEHLQKNLKNFHPCLQPKLKALSVLVNVKNKYKNFCGEPRRVYPTPAFLTEMENRYKERKKRWENIRNRRSEMEAEKERIIKEREEEEKKMEDLRKREILEELKEKRRKENEIKEERKREIGLLKHKLRLAEDHYTRYLLKTVGFQSWVKFIILRRNQMNTAIHHSEVLTCRTLLKHWRRSIALQVECKRRKAEELYEKIILRNSFQSWILNHHEYVQKIQVAMDWAEAKLSEKTFTLWLDNARAEHWYLMKKTEMAESFHERRAAIHCFKKWKEFPQLIRNEKEKEKRKKVWQRKVQEFLPDYQPAFLSEI